MCGRAKQFFRAALRKRLIAQDPFADMKGVSVRPNKSRERFVSRDVAARVLDACPDVQWRLIFALARYGGLRCPSEILSLTWGDVHWDTERMTIRSSKNASHDSGVRVMPIVPELRPHLDAVWQAAEPGTQHVITRYRQANANLRKRNSNASSPRRAWRRGPSCFRTCGPAERRNWSANTQPTSRPTG
jgi:integrase